MVDEVLLVAGWFRKFPEEERAKLAPAAAMARCAAVHSTLARPAAESAIRSRSA